MTRVKISNANSGNNNGMYGKTHSDEYKNKLSNSLKGKPFNTKDGIEKMRMSLRKKYAEKFLKTGIKNPRINPTACEFIDVFGRKNGYNFKHGLNGGEKYFSNVGAFVDGYDSEHNVIFEYDEKHHFDRFGDLKKKDVNRMNDLIKMTKCTVIRYNQLKNKIQEYSHD